MSSSVSNYLSLVPVNHYIRNIRINSTNVKFIGSKFFFGHFFIPSGIKDYFFHIEKNGLVHPDGSDRPSKCLSPKGLQEIQSPPPLCQDVIWIWHCLNRSVSMTVRQSVSWAATWVLSAPPYPFSLVEWISTPFGFVRFYPNRVPPRSGSLHPAYTIPIREPLLVRVPLCVGYRLLKISFLSICFCLSLRMLRSCSDVLRPFRNRLAILYCADMTLHCFPSIYLMTKPLALRKSASSYRSKLITVYVSFILCCFLFSFMVVRCLVLF